MGNFSYLIDFINCEGATIDWAKVVSETAGEANYHMNSDHQDERYPLLDTYEKLARALSNTKLYGYFSPEKNNILQTISKYSSLPPSGAHPIMFFEYEGFDEIAWIEFLPGESNVLYKTHKFQWSSDGMLFHLNNNTLPDEPWDYPENVCDEEREAKKKYLKALCHASYTSWSKMENLADLMVENAPMFAYLQKIQNHVKNNYPK